MQRRRRDWTPQQLRNCLALFYYHQMFFLKVDAQSFLYFVWLWKNPPKKSVCLPHAFEIWATSVKSSSLCRKNFSLHTKARCNQARYFSKRYTESFPLGNNALNIHLDRQENSPDLVKRPGTSLEHQMRHLTWRRKCLLSTRTSF